MASRSDVDNDEANDDIRSVSVLSLSAGRVGTTVQNEHGGRDSSHPVLTRTSYGSLPVQAGFAKQVTFYKHLRLKQYNTFSRD